MDKLRGNNVVNFTVRVPKPVWTGSGVEKLFWKIYTKKTEVYTTLFYL